MVEYSILGKKVPRKEEGILKATGKGKFVADIILPAMLYGRILTSPHAHARILNIDATKAMRLQGVKAIVTEKDLPDVRLTSGIYPVPLNSDLYPITKDKVRYIGELIAGVAAVDEDTAQEALDFIEVEYEILPAVFEAEEAMQPDAIKIHEHAERNIPQTTSNEYGDVEKGFNESDDIREDTFRYSVIAYCHPERQNATASYDLLSGKLTVWVSTQSVSGMRSMLSKLLGIPLSKVQVITFFVGGGYGGKLLTTNQCHVVAAILSRKAERPVKVMHLREEEFTTQWSGFHKVITTLKTGVKKDGTLMAREANVIFDVGAYNMQYGGSNPQASASNMYLPYKIPNLKATGIAVYTNKQPVGPFRGYGRYQVTRAVETQMDIIAKEIGIDPLEMRLANAVQTGYEDGFKLVTVKSCGLSECIQKAGKAIDWKERRKVQAAPRGKGISATFFPFVAIGTNRQPLIARVRINSDGTADLMILGSGSGAGQYFTLRMIVAEELGIPLENVSHPMQDTDVFPDEVPGISVTVASFGMPTKIAASKARQELLEAVANKLEANVEDLESKGGKIYVKGSPQKGMSFAEGAQIATAKKSGPIVARGEFYFTDIDNPEVAKRMFERFMRFGLTGMGAPAFSFGASAAEVEVDEETGKVRILRMAQAYDVGFALNPLGVEGQLQGGAILATGQALTEEMIHEDGQVLNPSYLNYKMLSAVDAPEVIPIIIEEKEDPSYAPYGAKELGMGAMSSCADAIASAIYDATGIMVKEFPATPERILEALEAKNRGR